MPQLLSLHSRVHVPQLLSPRATTTETRVPRAHALQQEKPSQREARAPQRRTAPHSPQLEKGCAQQWRPNAAKNKILKKKKRKKNTLSIFYTIFFLLKAHISATEDLLIKLTKCPDTFSISSHLSWFTSHLQYLVGSAHIWNL